MQLNNKLTGVAVLLLLPLFGCCPRTVIAEKQAPDSSYTAVAYSLECGPVPPFNFYVDVNTSAQHSKTVVSIRDIAVQAVPEWETKNVLKITLDCQAFVSAGGCPVPPQRYWTIDLQHSWNGINIKYEIGERLKQSVSAETLDDILHKGH